MPVLIDATIVSNFVAVGRLDLVRLALGTVHMAATVHAEVRRGVEEGYEFLRAVESHISPLHPEGWIHLTDLERDDERGYYERLASVVQPGEAASLAIAASRGLAFATDDRRARLFAAREGVEVTGTLGILLQLEETGALTLDEANGLLMAMIDRGRYRSPVTDLRSLLGGSEGP